MGIKQSQYERRLQIKHFFDDRQTGQTRRTWLEIQLAPPERSSEGWVNDGKVRLSLGEDRDIKGVSTVEAFNPTQYHTLAGEPSSN